MNLIFDSLCHHNRPAGAAHCQRVQLVSSGVRTSGCALLPAVLAHPGCSAPRVLTCRAVVTDQAVPEGHKGLHGFLYGEGGAELHDFASDYVWREVSLRLTT